MPEVPKIQKKLCEAKFFLNHMMQSARSTRLDHEHLEFYLSAFLSAARSVTDFFEKRNQKAWWSQWRANRFIALNGFLLRALQKAKSVKVGCGAGRGLIESISPAA